MKIWSLQNILENHLGICSTSSRAVTRLTVYRASHISVWKTKVPDLAQVELAHTQNIVS